MILFSLIWIPVVLFFLCSTHKEVTYERNNESYENDNAETIEHNIRDDTLFCLQKEHQSKHYHSE